VKVQQIYTSPRSFPPQFSTFTNTSHHVLWLLVSTPLKNMKVSWDHDIPNIWKIKFMFQTTNQSYVCFFLFVWGLVTHTHTLTAIHRSSCVHQCFREAFDLGTWKVDAMRMHKLVVNHGTNSGKLWRSRKNQKEHHWILAILTGYFVDIGIELEMENVTELLTTKQLNKIFGWATEHRDLPQFMAMVFSTGFFGILKKYGMTQAFLGMADMGMFFKNQTWQWNICIEL